MIARVYIGFDPREVEAYRVAEGSLRMHANVPVLVTPLDLARNEAWGLMQRPWRVCRNSLWDVISDAPMSTQFANTRFLTLMLAQTGWVVFVDCDVVFMADIDELLQLADPRYAVMCVKHRYTPSTAQKMDGQVQTQYSRKNWSSVMLLNADHPSNRKLTLRDVNGVPGRDLHRFFWLEDDEIGELPGEWNWLVNEQPEPARPKIAHFTLGGPWLPDWKGAPYDDLWTEYHRRITTAR
jgi:hypothetical protein